MNKMMFRKIVCLVIALLMMMPVMPSGLVGAEEIINKDDVSQNIINSVTTGSAIGGAVEFTVEHYLQNQDGTYPETASESESITTIESTVFDDDYQKSFDGYTYVSGEVDGVSDISDVASDTVLRLYYQVNNEPLMMMQLLSTTGVYESKAGVMNALGQSTNDHLIGYLSWIDKDSNDLYIAFNQSNTAVAKTLLGVIYNGHAQYGGNLNANSVINMPLTIDGVPYTHSFPNWLVINLGQQTLTDPFYIELDYSENGFDAMGKDRIKIEILNYTVTYNPNGGTGTLTDAQNPYDQYETVTVLPNTFTYAGRYFVSWNTKANGSGTTYFPNNTFSMPAGDVVLYAQWSLLPQAQYKVEHYLENLNANTFSLADTDYKSGTQGTMTAAEAKTYAGFTVQTFAQETILADGSTVVEIYYTRNNYELTINYEYEGKR